MILGVDYFKMSDPELLHDKYYKARFKNDIYRCNRCGVLMEHSKYKNCYDCNVNGIRTDKQFSTQINRLYEKTQYNRPELVANIKKKELTENIKGNENKIIQEEIRDEIVNDKDLIRWKYSRRRFKLDLIAKCIKWYEYPTYIKDYDRPSGTEQYYTQDIGAFIYETKDEEIIEPDLKNVIDRVMKKIELLYDKLDDKTLYVNACFKGKFDVCIEKIITDFANKIKLRKVSKKEYDREVGE